MRMKTFRDNDSYFKFIEKMRDIIEVYSVKILKKSIRIEYEVIEGEENE